MSAPGLLADSCSAAKDVFDDLARARGAVVVPISVRPQCKASRIDVGIVPLHNLSLNRCFQPSQATAYSSRFCLHYQEKTGAFAALQPEVATCRGCSLPCRLFALRSALSKTSPGWTVRERISARLTISLPCRAPRAGRPASLWRCQRHIAAQKNPARLCRAGRTFGECRFVHESFFTFKGFRQGFRNGRDCVRQQLSMEDPRRRAPVFGAHRPHLL